MVRVFLRKAIETNSEQKKKKVYFSSLCNYFNPQEKKTNSATKKEIFHLLNKKCNLLSNITLKCTMFLLTTIIKTTIFCRTTLCSGF